MAASPYERLKIHTENLRKIVANLEMSIDLAERLGAFTVPETGDLVISLVDTDAEISAAIAENVQRALNNIDILSDEIERARGRIVEAQRLLNLEHRFGMNERRIAAQRSAGKRQ